MLIPARRGFIPPVAALYASAGGGAAITSISLSGPQEILDNAAAGEQIGLLSATGGTAPFTWSEVSDPDGKFTVASNGIVTLSATVTAGTHSFTARATDANSQTLDQSFDITVTANSASYANVLGTGDRTASITMSVTSSVGGGTVSQLIDGATTNSFWVSNWPIGTYVRADFGSGHYKNLTELRLKQSNSASVSGVQVRFSNDGINWKLQDTITLGGGTNTTSALTSPYGYRYVELRGTSGSRLTGFLQELEFKIADGPQSPSPIFVGNQWDPAETAATVTLSNGNLTATRSSGSGWYRVRAAIGKSSGKWGFRVTPTMAGSETQIGLLAQAANSISNDYLGHTADGVGYSAVNGSIARNNTLLATAASYSNGNPVDIVVDIDSMLMWVRKSEGDWNDSATADPATGTEGVDISSITGSMFFPAWSGNATGDVALADFACAGFTLPSGFSAWNS